MAGSFLLNNESNTPPLYRFKLLRPDTRESIILKHEPLEWGDGTIEVDRDISIGGVFTQFSVDSLTFIKEGANFIRTIWDEKEINGECDLIIYWFKFSTRTYVEMPSRFSLNFATIKPRVKIQNIGIGVEVETVKSSILVKLENNRNKKFDLTQTTLQDYTNLKKNLNFGAIGVYNLAEWRSYPYYTRPLHGPILYEITNNKDKDIYTQFQMNYITDEFTECTNIEFESSIEDVNNVDRFLVNAVDDYELTFVYDVTFHVFDRKTGADVYFMWAEFDETGAFVDEHELGQFGGLTGDRRYNDSVTINLDTGHSLAVYVKADHVKSFGAYVRFSYFRISTPLVYSPTATVETFPIYEALERSLQLNIGVQFPFYSEFFGRTDTVYNQDEDVYLTENQLRFANIMSGLHLRGTPLSDYNSPLSISFNDLFKSVNALWNVGYEIENRDNFDRVRIENYNYFFEDTQVLDLSDRLNKYDIETESMPDLCYSFFRTGYKDFEYGEQNGRGEYNTINERTSVLNTDSVYDNVSELRGDTMGISQKISYGKESTDTEEDNSVFIVKTQRDGDEWTPELEENINIVGGSSYFGDDSLNLYFTPTRMLKRHGNRIKGAFAKYLSSELRFQYGGKLQTLETSGNVTSEDYTVVERDNLSVNDLDEPIFKPIKHIVTVKFTLSDFEILMNNPKGYIKLSDTISGYLLNLRKKNGEDRATIEVIEKYN